MAAERREFDGLLVHVDEIKKPGWPVDFARLGRLNGRPVAMVANGPGPKLAGAAVDVVKEHGGMDTLVSIGFCGGLQPSLKVCDIFVATEVNGVALALLPVTQRPFQSGTLLSIDRVVTTTAEKAALAQNAGAVEMEAAAVAARAQKWSVPFYAVRVVTDTWHDAFPVDFNRMRSRDGHFSMAKILAAAVRKPATIFPDLIKLNKTTKRASQALGDFLADARF